MTATAISALIAVLVVTNPFAKVIASVAYSLCIVLFLVRLAVLGMPVLDGRMKALFLIVAAYLTFLLASVTYSLDAGEGLRQFFGQSKIIMLPVLVVFMQGPRSARRYLVAGAAGGTVLSLITILDGLVRHVDRPPAMWNSVHGGNLLMFSALGILVLLLHEDRLRPRLIAAAALLVHGYALYLNGTRGAWMAFAAGALVMPLFMRSLRTWMRFAYYGAVAVLVALLLQTSYVRHRLQYTLDDMMNSAAARSERSFGGRYEIWRASLDMFQDHPLLGVGLGGWKKASEDLVRSGRAAIMVLDYNQAHMIYLDALSTRGVVGLTMFFVLVGFLVFAVWPGGGSDQEMFRVLALTATVAFLVSGLTDTLVLIRGVFMAYLLLVGISLSAIVRGTEAAR